MGRCLGHLHRPEHGAVGADLELRGKVAGAGHQRMHKTAGLDGLGPIRVGIGVKGLPLGNDVGQRSAPTVAPFIGGQAVLDGLVGGGLQIGIQRGVNAQSAFMHFGTAILLLQVLPDLLDEIGSE